MSKPLNLESFSFTVSEAEGAAIYMLASSHGFAPDSKGVKAYLLWSAGLCEKEASPAPETEEEKDEFSQHVGIIFDALARNPQVTGPVIKKGAELVGTLLKKLL